MDDEPGFDDFVTERCEALLRYAYVLTGNPHDAADLTQEALTRLRDAWPRVRRKTDAHGHARTTMARLHISIWRRRRREHLTGEPPERTWEAVFPSDEDQGLWRAPAALLAAAAVVAVAVGAGTATRTLGPPDVRLPGANATDTRGSTPEEKPPIERVWPQAVRRIPARLPDGRAYVPQSLLDGRTLLVMTEAGERTRQSLWAYDLESGRPRRIAEISPDPGSTTSSGKVVAGGGNIAWWTSYRKPGGQRGARIWTVPAGGGTPRKVADVPPGSAAGKDHVKTLEVVGSDVFFSRAGGGVYRVPLRGGEPRAVPGTEGQNLLRWPWVGHDSEQALFAELFNAETGERRAAVVRPGEISVRCDVRRCHGQREPGRPDRDLFVRDRDGSRERALPSGVRAHGTSYLERFYLRHSKEGLALYDLVTGVSADLDRRRITIRNVTLVDAGFGWLSYRIGQETHVVNLAAIR
ncbi:sigma factor [Streptosporangium sp. NPDC002721]|uniref:sigma factor n=1 Tax=Streptosporangium sp. NPDC002721 TaxID=3366188 RepID=UPI00367AB93A